MKIDILTLFPAMFEGVLGESILKRAQEKSLVEVKIHNLRGWANDKHKTVDAKPYGGGAGMVIRVDIIDRAVSDIKAKNKNARTKVILLSAKGKTYTQSNASELSKLNHLILVCGHYEGIDHRVHEHIADEVISIGDYVLTGGEIPAMVVVDSVVRLIPGVIKPDSLEHESFADGKTIEHPQYTRPETYKGWKVPKILLSGDHAKIEKWRKR